MKMEHVRMLMDVGISGGGNVIQRAGEEILKYTAIIYY
jgi:hypothetical protein